MGGVFKGKHGFLYKDLFVELKGVLLVENILPSWREYGVQMRAGSCVLLGMAGQENFAGQRPLGISI